MRRSMKSDEDGKDAKAPTSGRRTRSLYSVAELPLRRSSRISKQNDSSEICELPRNTRSRSRSSTRELETESVKNTRRVVRAGSETKTMTPGTVTRRTRASSVTMSDDDLKATLSTLPHFETPSRTRKRLSMAPTQPSLAEETQDMKEANPSSTESPIIVIEDEISVESDSTTAGDVEETDSKHKDKISSPKACPNDAKASEINLSNGCDKSQLSDLSNSCKKSIESPSDKSSLLFDDSPTETCQIIDDEVKSNKSKIKFTQSKETSETINVTEVIPEKVLNPIQEVDSDSDVDVCGSPNKSDEVCKGNAESEDSNEEIDVCDINATEKENIENQEVFVVLEDVLEKVKQTSSYCKIKQLFFSKRKEQIHERRSISEGVNTNNSLSKKRNSLSAELVRKIAKHISDTDEEKTSGRESDAEKTTETIKETEIVEDETLKTNLIGQEEISQNAPEIISIVSDTEATISTAPSTQEHGSIIPETDYESESENLINSINSQDDIQILEETSPAIEEDSFLTEINQFPIDSPKKIIKTQILQENLRESPEKLSKQTILKLSPKKQFSPESPQKAAKSPRLSAKYSESPKKLNSPTICQQEKKSPNIEKLEISSPIEDKIQDIQSPIKNKISNENSLNSPNKNELNVSNISNNSINEENSNKRHDESISISLENSELSPNTSNINITQLCEEESPVNINLTYESESETEEKAQEIIENSPSELETEEKAQEINQNSQSESETEEKAQEIMENSQSESETEEKPEEIIENSQSESIENKSETEEKCQENVKISECEFKENNESEEALETNEDSEIETANSKSENELKTIETAENLNHENITEELSSDTVNKSFDCKNDIEKSKDKSLCEENCTLKEMSSVSPKKKIISATETESEINNKSSEAVTQILEPQEVSENLQSTEEICKSKELENVNLNVSTSTSDSKNNSIIDLEKVNFENRISPSPENRRSSIVAGSPEKQTEDDNPLFYFQDVTAEEFTTQPKDDLILLDDDVDEDDEPKFAKNKTDNDSSIIILPQDGNERKEVKSGVSRLSIEFIEKISEIEHLPDNSIEKSPAKLITSTSKEIIEKSPEKIEKSPKKKIDSSEKIIEKSPEKIEKSPKKIN
ncbi:putative leucine-rich repeat-containing protein DDB_G0290503, partial [Leptopilina heterotoma]|uniref:putative leucine-rich repeat-containing protein DDB_G0290503 n=1 Tax=Leptopilina heterotoma TaxID=63436 RepID=UPI001CAA1D5F